MVRRVHITAIFFLCLTACGTTTTAGDAGPGEGDAAWDVTGDPIFSEVVTDPGNGDTAAADADAPITPDVTTDVAGDALKDATLDATADVVGDEVMGDVAGDVAMGDDAMGDVVGDTTEVDTASVADVDGDAIDATPVDAEDTQTVVEPTTCEGLDNGAVCEDGDLCTVGDTCLIGVCQPGEPTICDGQGPCRVGTCAPTTGTCSYVDVPEGDPCDDGDACTLGDTCKAGACAAGTALACDDQNPCTDDLCD
ncbi:MAG: hypothetical protein QF464_11465, partial [Myxococcota bacterium]|nr:hypothetical protein [Myxococcota bacterium]